MSVKFIGYIGFNNGSETQAAVRVLRAQGFQAVGSEIDHQQQAAGPQHPRRLGQQIGRRLREMQHLVDDRRVEGPGRERKLVHVRLPDVAVA